MTPQGIFTVLIWLQIIKLCSADYSTCTDDLSAAECLTRKNNLDCIFDKENGTSCLCHETCVSSNLCAAANGALLDSRCDCLSYVDQCGGNSTPKPSCPLANWQTECMKTSFTFEYIYCDDSMTLPHLEQSRAKNHGDIKEYWCPAGYKKIGGSRGLTVCWDGDLKQHGIYGDYPVCEIITCSYPPKVLYTNPSATQLTVFNNITYTCQNGTEKIDGDDGMLECGVDGFWHPYNTTSNPICIGDFAFYIKLPTYTPTVLLTTYQCRSSVHCASLCLNSYMCVGFTFNSTSGICSLNESGDQGINTQMIQSYPY